MSDEQLYKAWWFAVAYGAGLTRRMEILDRLRNRYAEPTATPSAENPTGL